MLSIDDKEAILGYLEFHLISFAAETEKHITDSKAVGNMYEGAYSILADFEETLETQLTINALTLLKTNK